MPTFPHTHSILHWNLSHLCQSVSIKIWSIKACWLDYSSFRKVPLMIKRSNNCTFLSHIKFCGFLRIMGYYRIKYNWYCFDRTTIKKKKPSIIYLHQLLAKAGINKWWPKTPRRLKDEKYVSLQLQKMLANT